MARRAPSEILISPTFKEIQQENLLQPISSMKSVIFRLPDDRSPPTRDQPQQRTTLKRIVSTDEDNCRPRDGLGKKMEEYSSPDGTSSSKSVFFSPIEPINTPSRDVFFTPELASPTLLEDIQSSQSIQTLRKLKTAFESDYPSLSRRTEARIHELLVNSPASVLAGENLITSPAVNSMSTSIVTLGMSLSTEEDEIMMQQFNQYQTQTETRQQTDSTAHSSFWPAATSQTVSTEGGFPAELVSPLSNDQGAAEYQELLQSVQDLREHNRKLQLEIREQVLERQKATRETYDTEQHFLSQIRTMQESLGAAENQTEQERAFFMQVQVRLNRRLKEAKQRLEDVRRERDGMIASLKQLVAENDDSMNADELVQKIAASMKAHDSAKRELAQCLEAVQKELRIAKDGKHKSERLLTVATNRSRKLEVENKQLLSQVKALSEELNQTRDKFNAAIDAQKQQQLKQWQEQEKRYMAMIQKLRDTVRNQENTVSMDLYRHAVAESKRHAEQCQIYQQQAKVSSERLQSLERMVQESQRHTKAEQASIKAPPKVATLPGRPSSSSGSRVYYTNPPQKPATGDLPRRANAAVHVPLPNAGAQAPPPPPRPNATTKVPPPKPSDAATMPPPKPNALHSKPNPTSTTNEPQRRSVNAEEKSKPVPLQTSKSAAPTQPVEQRKDPMRKQTRFVDTSSNRNIPKQVRFKAHHSPRHRSTLRVTKDATLPIPNKAPPAPLIRMQPSKENSWIAPSRSSSSKLRSSLVRAAGGRLKLQTILRERRQPLKEALSN